MIYFKIIVIIINIANKIKIDRAIFDTLLIKSSALLLGKVLIDI